MEITLNKLAKRLVQKRIKSGEYKTPEDVILAALASMEQSAKFNFAPGELDALIAEGEESIKKHGTLDAKKVFADLRRRKKLRKAS